VVEVVSGVVEVVSGVVEVVCPSSSPGRMQGASPQTSPVSTIRLVQQSSTPRPGLVDPHRLPTATLRATGIAAPVEFNRQGKGFWAAKSRVGVHVGGSMYSFFVWMMSSLSRPRIFWWDAGCRVKGWWWKVGSEFWRCRGFSSGGTLCPHVPTRAGPYTRNPKRSARWYPVPM